LAFIRHARDLGFTLEAIRDLRTLSDTPDQSCAAADTIAKSQLAEVESRLLRLAALKTELERMIQQCAGGSIADCKVIEVLGDHSLCATDHRHPETQPTH
jgi:DNA-binding transcriptional MerR regulator